VQVLASLKILIMGQHWYVLAMMNPKKISVTIVYGTIAQFTKGFQSKKSCDLGGD